MKATGILAALACLSLAGPAAAEELQALEADVFDGALTAARGMPRLHSLLVSQDGKLLVEEYFNGRDPWQTANVKSVSKSIISALVGIAIGDGHLAGLDQPIGEFFPDLLDGSDAGKGAITIGNLLSMQAGLETTSFYNYGAWVLSDDWSRFALRQPLVAEPGADMVYSTGNTHLLSGILTRATGKSTLEYARERLSGPLGFRFPAWTRDPQGIYFGGNNMELTPRQMLAFGELYLNGGAHRGQQIVPADWVSASLAPRVRSPRDDERQYALGWWVRDMAGTRTAYAWGYGGQFILLVPDLDLVAVTTSESTPGDTRRRHIRSLYDLLERRIVAPALQASGMPVVLTAD